MFTADIGESATFAFLSEEEKKTENKYLAKIMVEEQRYDAWLQI